MYETERKKRILEEEGIDTDAIEEEIENIMESIIKKEFSIAEVEVLINSLTLTAKQLRYRKPGNLFTYEVKLS